MWARFQAPDNCDCCRGILVHSFFFFFVFPGQRSTAWLLFCYYVTTIAESCRPTYFIIFSLISEKIIVSLEYIYILCRGFTWDWLNLYMQLKLKWSVQNAFVDHLSHWAHSIQCHKNMFWHRCNIYNNKIWVRGEISEWLHRMRQTFRSGLATRWGIYWKGCRIEHHWCAFIIQRLRG